MVGSQLWMILSKPDDHEQQIYVASLISAVIFGSFLPIIRRGWCRTGFVICVGIMNHIIFCRLQLVFLLLSGIGTYFLIISNCRLLNCYLLPFGVLFLARALAFLSIIHLSPLTNVSLLLFTFRVIDFARYALHNNDDFSDNPSISTINSSSCLKVPQPDSLTIFLLFVSHLTYFPGLWSGPLLPPGHVFSCLLRDPTAMEKATSSVLTPSSITSETTKHSGNISEDDSNSDNSYPSPVITRSPLPLLKRIKASKISSCSTKERLKSNDSRSSEEYESNDISGCFFLSLQCASWNMIRQRYYESLEFLVVRFYETCLYILVLIIALPYLAHIQKSHPLKNEAIILHNFITLYDYLPFRFLKFSSSMNWISRGLNSYSALFLLHLVVRARFFFAWFLAEFTVIVSGIRSDESLCFTDAVAIWKSPESTVAVSTSQTISGGAKQQKYKEEYTASSIDSSKNKHYFDKSSPPCPKLLSCILSQHRYTNVKQFSKICCNYCSSNVEFGCSLAQILRNWNQTVQSWLVRNIYKMYKPKSQLLRRLAVVGVSAFWHGLHPGYYVAFLSLPIFQLSQTSFNKTLDYMMPSIIVRNSEGPRNSRLRNFINIAISQLLISFAVVPFTCLSISKTLETWKKLHYYGFYLGGIMWLIGMLDGKVKKS